MLMIRDGLTGTKCAARFRSALTSFAVIALALVYPACKPPQQATPWGDDSLNTVSLKLGSAEAVNCGRVPIRGDPKPATGCVLTAFSNKRPFRVRYDLHGVDSEIAFGVVGTPEGKVFEIDFDGNPAGGGRTPPGGGMTTIKTCPMPIVLKVSASGGVFCLPDEPLWHELEQRKPSSFLKDKLLSFLLPAVFLGSALYALIRVIPKVIAR